ncbi:thiamine phosphate synthase [Dactylosporangium salmoneum]|uniref:Thiamine-phosphate synthase n=1 Tax=Dactylosporangium salmoneum TaxID=53361 RepID=A0ABN3G8G3_9ACTN
MSLDLSLYLVTDSRLAARCGHDLADLVLAAAESGVTAVQVREKDAPSRAFLDAVLRLAEVLPEHVTLIVNDRIDVFLAARSTGARVSGVHVGQLDLPVVAVRGMIGADAILGLSASTEEQLRSAESSPAHVDYVGIGALHSTPTKPDAPPPLGHGGFARLAAATSLPAVAIGGVKHADLPQLRAAGAAGAAIVSAICAAADPGAVTHELRTTWEAGASVGTQF